MAPLIPSSTQQKLENLQQIASQNSLSQSEMNNYKLLHIKNLNNQILINWRIELISQKSTMMPKIITHSSSKNHNQINCDRVALHQTPETRHNNNSTKHLNYGSQKPRILIAFYWKPSIAKAINNQKFFKYFYNIKNDHLQQLDQDRHSRKHH